MPRVSWLAIQGLVHTVAGEQTTQMFVVGLHHTLAS